MAQFSEVDGTFKIIYYYANFETYIVEHYIWNTIFKAYHLTSKTKLERLENLETVKLAEEFNKEGRYDAYGGVALHQHSFTANISFLPSTLEESYDVFIRSPKSSYNYFLDIFSDSTLIAIFLTIFLASLIIGLYFYYFKPVTRNEYFEAVLIMIGISSEGSENQITNQTIFRIIRTSISMLIWILLTALSAFLISTLVSDKPSLPFNSLEELFNTGYTLCLDETEYPYKIISKNSKWNQFLNGAKCSFKGLMKPSDGSTHMLSPERPYFQLLCQSLEDEKVAILSSRRSTNDQLLYHNYMKMKCGVTRVISGMYPHYEAMISKVRYPRKHEADSMLIKMRTTGVLNNIFASRDPSDYKSNASDDIAITFQNIQILFFGYAFAVVIVLIVFGCEFFYYYYFRNAEQFFT